MLPHQQLQQHNVTSMKENKYGTLETLKTHPLFCELTAKQQQWLLRYLETGDRIVATNEVYPWTNKPNKTKHDYAEERASRNMRIPAIRTVIAAYRGEEPPALPMSRKELAAQIGRELRKGDVSLTDFLRLSQQLIVVNGWHRQTQINTTIPNASKRSVQKLIPRTDKENEQDFILELEKAFKG